VSKVLEMDSDFTEVKCPKCQHEWFTRMTLGTSATIRCPHCQCPLKAPTWETPALDNMWDKPSYPNKESKD